MVAGFALCCALGTPTQPVFARDSGIAATNASGVIEVAQPARLARTNVWSGTIAAVSSETGVPRAVLRALMTTESGGLLDSIDPATGARGLMHVTPQHLADVSGHVAGGDLDDPHTNVRVAGYWLRFAYEKWGSWDLAAAAWNVGGWDLRDRVFPTEFVRTFHGYLDELGYQSTNSEFAATALARAFEVKGAPYVAGGQSPEVGFDCSGLVWWAYREAGRGEMPRPTDGQWNYTQRISREELRPGDLIFFGGGGWISHVGLYAGDNMMYHSQDYGVPVGSVNLDESYWAANVIGYGRLP